MDDIGVAAGSTFIRLEREGGNEKEICQDKEVGLYDFMSRWSLSLLIMKRRRFF